MINMNFRFTAIFCVIVLALFVCLSGCTGTEDANTPISENISSLFSGTSDDKKKATENLIAEGEPAVIPLTKVFSKGDQTASTWAAVALLYIGEPSVDPLIRLLSSGDDEETKWAGNTLSAFGTTAVPALIEEVKTGTKNSKELAAIALIKIGEPAVPLLQYELNLGDNKYSDEFSSIIQSIYATKGLQERIENETIQKENGSLTEE